MVFQRNHKITECSFNCKAYHEGIGKMSEEGSFGVSALEKLFGVIVLLIGVAFMYYTLTNNSVLAPFTGFLSVLGLFLVVLGFFLATVKVE